MVADVAEIGTSPPVLVDAFSGGVRRRLCISTSEGVEIFVVWRVASKVKRLRTSLGV
jgi:hypothetical protein